MIASTWPVQLPHTYTSVVYKCMLHSDGIVQKTIHNTTPELGVTTLESHHTTRDAAFTVAQTGKFHTGSTTGLEIGLNLVHVRTQATRLH